MEQAIKESVASALWMVFLDARRDWEIAEETGDIEGQNEATRKGIRAMQQIKKLEEVSNE